VKLEGLTTDDGILAKYSPFFALRYLEIEHALILRDTAFYLCLLPQVRVKFDYE